VAIKFMMLNLYRVDVGSVAYVSEANAASTFRVESTSAMNHRERLELVINYLIKYIELNPS
jgi:hypothetical protein